MEGIHRNLLSSVRRHKNDIVNFIKQAPGWRLNFGVDLKSVGWLDFFGGSSICEMCFQTLIQKG